MTTKLLPPRHDADLPAGTVPAGPLTAAGLPRRRPGTDLPCARWPRVPSSRCTVISVWYFPGGRPVAVRGRHLASRVSLRAQASRIGPVPGGRAAGATCTSSRSYAGCLHIAPVRREARTDGRPGTHPSWVPCVPRTRPRRGRGSGAAHHAHAQPRPSLQPRPLPVAPLCAPRPRHTAASARRCPNVGEIPSGHALPMLMWADTDVASGDAVERLPFAKGRRQIQAFTS